MAVAGSTRQLRNLRGCYIRGQTWWLLKGKGMHPASSMCPPRKPRNYHVPFRFVQIALIIGRYGTTLRERDIKSICLCMLSYSLKQIEWIFTLFVTDVTPWVVTSVITSFGVNIEWTGRDSTRWVVNFTLMELESSEIYSSTNEMSSLHRWSELFTRFFFRE